MSARFQFSIYNFQFTILAFILALLLTTLYLLPTTVHAQDVATQSAIAPANLSNITPLSPIYSNILVINLVHTFSCVAQGVSIIGQPCISGFDVAGKLKVDSSSGGLIGSVG